MMDRKRIARFVLVAGALIVAVHFARQWPKDQTVHYILGDGAPAIEEIDARWAENGGPSGGDEWTREATFRYAPGHAPRIVTHEPRLPDGDYTVEIAIVASGRPEGTGTGKVRREALVRRRVALSGGVTSIDLASAVPVSR
jgi:hypothetical protein